MSENDQNPIDHDGAEQIATTAEEQTLQSRRDFLIGLGKWSRAVVAGAVVGSSVLLAERPAQAGWLNRRGCCYGGGGGWINGRGGGGGGWINRRGGWGGSGWVNFR